MSLPGAQYTIGQETQETRGTVFLFETFVMFNKLSLDKTPVSRVLWDTASFGFVSEVHASQKPRLVSIIHKGERDCFFP